jgi:hypothetical protein
MVRRSAYALERPGGGEGATGGMVAPQTRIERATCPLGGGCSIH